MNGDSKIDLAVIDTKLEFIQKDIKDIKRQIGSFTDSQDKVQTRVTRLEEKLNNLTAFQMFLSIASSSIAGWLGMQK